MIKLCLGGERGSEKVSALKVISQQVCEEGGLSCKGLHRRICNSIIMNCRHSLPFAFLPPCMKKLSESSPV